MAINLLDWRQQQSSLKIRIYLLATVILICVAAIGLLVLQYCVEQEKNYYDQNNAFLKEKLMGLDTKLHKNNIKKNYQVVRKVLNMANSQLDKQALRLTLISQLPQQIPRGICLSQLQVNTHSLILNGNGLPSAVARLVLTLTKLPALADVKITELSQNKFIVVSTIIYPKSHAA